jgi:MinD-like ATPase involved in chromosome partitioning or flagellar assembly/tetratricopeptide (TPR) repeat protein
MPEVSAGQSSVAGQVITFYSFKGGTGRTMALANVAWILAANGKRVLIADWDLESPGLHRFFQPFMEPAVSAQPGVIDFIRKYEWAIDELLGPSEPDSSDDGPPPLVTRAAITRLINDSVREVSRLAVPVNWEFPGSGSIEFLTPGQQDNGVFKQVLSALNWDILYQKLYGAQFLDELRAYLKRSYDYVLIDSRTGLSDIADICTLHLPDMVVDCFTLSTQGIEGAAMVAKQIQDFTRRKIELLPVPMRIDHSRPHKVTAGMQFVERKFGELPVGRAHEERDDYWADVEVPYRPEYAYEETLAAFGDRPGEGDSLLASYERITARITDREVTKLPPRQEWLRLRTWRKFSRTPSAIPLQTVIDFSPQDQLWGEWIAAVLAGAGVSTRLATEPPAGPDETETRTQVVAVMSDSYLARYNDQPIESTLDLPRRPDVLIAVADTRNAPESLGEMPVISLIDLSAEAAVERLTDWFEVAPGPERESVTSAIRYPGQVGGQVDNLPTRNPNFTGRDNVLRQLREELRSRGRAVVIQAPKLAGIGGIGKTQLALEYAHRFKDDYDVVWWLRADPPQYVDASLLDLGAELRTVFGAAISLEGSEAAAQVLRYLSSERSTQRWLLIYDNAEEVARLQRLLPAGGGHVLITSRNERWKDQPSHVQAVELDFFQRLESVGHLRRRRRGITAAEADTLATELGDMPLAVAAAGALLASEKISVPEYLGRLREQPDRSLMADHELGSYPEAVARAWHLSLDVLAQRSPAAARLLEICSVMAPDVSLNLIYSDAIVTALQEADPKISLKAMIGRLVTQIDSLALIKVEQTARQLVVHRVVQTVVRERMSQAQQLAARRHVHEALVGIRPGGVDDPREWPAYRQIWPHLRPTQAELSEKEQVRELLLDRVRYLRQRDDFGAGNRRAESIDEAWSEMLANETVPEKARVLRAQLYRLRFHRANLLRDLGWFSESRALDEAVLAEQRKELGDDHPHTLQTRGSLGADLRALGQYAEALDFAQATYESWSQGGYGDDDPGTLMAANNLALSNLLNGNSRDALRRDRQTYRLRLAQYGSPPAHPLVFFSGVAIGRDLIEVGRYREAVRTLTETTEQAKEALDEARITLDARLWLGIAHRCNGQPRLAEASVNAAVNQLVRGFGRGSSSTLAGRLSQALNQLALGKYADGRVGLEQVLTAYEEWLGSDHPNTLVCRLNAATALCLEEDYLAARTRVEAAASGLATRLGRIHPYTLSANMMRGSVLACLGNLDDAAALEKQVLDDRIKVLGSEHPDTLRSQANQLLTQQLMGVNGQSGRRQDIIEALTEQLGSEHPDVAAASRNGRLFCMIDPQPF